MAINIPTEEDNVTSHQSAASMTEHSTGVKDAVYSVVSVLYHALQGGETCTQYLQEAQETRDQKLVQFFQEVQECHRHLATRAKEVLAQFAQGTWERSLVAFFEAPTTEEPRCSLTYPQGLSGEKHTSSIVFPLREKTE
jgi:hypothetical protein